MEFRKWVAAGVISLTALVGCVEPSKRDTSELRRIEQQNRVNYLKNYNDCKPYNNAGRPCPINRHY